MSEEPASGAARPGGERAGMIVAASAVVVLACLHLLYYLPRTVDDMYIFLRYADNLASGAGAVYNAGESVEGHSSPAWVGLLAVGAWLGVGGVSWSKVLGAGSLAALLAGLYAFGRRGLGLTRWGAWVAPAFTALNSYVVSWSTWGLETPLYLALVVWAAVGLVGCVGEDAGASGGRGGWALAWGACAALALVRPEAPLLLGAVAVGVWLGPGRAAWGSGARLRRLGLALAPAVVAWASYGVFRRVTTGLWLPHTYYAKQGGGLAFGQWAPLWAQGASWPEVVMALGGLGLAVWVWARRRSAVPLGVFVAVLVFVAGVIVDWMPNQRHFLPLWCFAPLVWAAGLEGAVAVGRGGERAGQRALGWAGAAVAAGVLVWTGVQLATIDARYSPFDFKSHGRGQRWILPKRAEAWTDTWRCLRRERPAHVDAMGPFQHGMITQLYRLLESDARPLEATWYVGRDIGRVGYLAPVRVFDTDGLFTPAVVQDAGWQVDREVSPGLIGEALGRDVAMTELDGPWRRAASAAAWRSRYEDLGGGVWLRPREGHRPSDAQVVARYEAALAKLPTSWYVMTLYGEGVGAALDRRLEVVRGEVEARRDAVGGAVPEGLSGGGVTLDGVVRLHGCSAAPEAVSAGESFTLTCWFEASGPVARDYTVFVHAEGPGVRFLGDHPPVAGGLSTRAWPVGKVVRDTAQVRVPPGTSRGEVELHLGLFEGAWRAKVAPVSGGDGQDRVVVGRVRVR